MIRFAMAPGWSYVLEFIYGEHESLFCHDGANLGALRESVRACLVAHAESEDPIIRTATVVRNHNDAQDLEAARRAAIKKLWNKYTLSGDLRGAIWQAYIASPEARKHWKAKRPALKGVKAHAQGQG